MSQSATAYPHLGKAPIVEAVIDFRVKLASDFELDAFHPLRLKLVQEYPSFEEQQLIEQRIEQEPGQPMQFSTRVSGIHGHRLRSEDGKSIVQFRRDGYTFSRLNPYTTWEDVFTEAWRLWRMYVETAQPIEVSRLAARYINRLLFPLPFADPSKFLKAPPVVAEGWPTSMSSFLTRIVINDPENEVAINVIQAVEPQPPGEQTHLPLLFDIDAYQDVTLNADDVTIAERFAKLRQAKNRIFFSGLTDEAIELFQ